MRTWQLFRGASRPLAALLVVGLLLFASTACAQDAYWSQPFANRLADNPAWAGLVDDRSATLSYRDQFPQLPGSFITSQLAADWRLPQPGQHQALGLLVRQDRSGQVGYTRFELAGQYAYHRRLTRRLALSAGGQVGYGRQRVAYDNLTFGDQYAADGSLRGPTADPLAGTDPVNYVSLGLGAVLYTEQAWLSLAGQHLNQPDLGFQAQALLPRRLTASAGYKLFVRKPAGYRANEVREISLTPTLAYTQQGGSHRSEAGLYLLADPVTLGLAYRNLDNPRLDTQHLLVLTAGVAVGDLRVGYSYDVGLTAVAANLGGAHEITLALRAFDRLETAARRLKRRAYPVAPCPRF